MNNVTKQLLEEKYITEKKTMQTIADELGCSYKYIFYKMKFFGIPSRRSWRDLTGQVFDYLTVLHRDDKKSSAQNSRSFWHCRCKCGCERSFRGRALLSGKAKSCGCRSLTRHGGISGKYWCQISGGAARRKIKFSINIKEAWNLFEKQKGICALSGLLLKLSLREQDASLDRIDSNKPYVLDNVQWVHRDINRMKSNLKESRFLELCSAVTNYATIS